MRIIKTYQTERMNEMSYEAYSKKLESELLKKIESEKKFSFRKLLNILELEALLSTK